MAHNCTSICSYDERFKYFAGNSLSYKQGIKRCIICKKSVITDESFCPCCGNHLRMKTRNSLFKEYL